jgi:hypothetical protein
MMKKVPNRSVRCEVTTAWRLSVPQARIGIMRSMTIARPHRT